MGMFSQTKEILVAEKKKQDSEKQAKHEARKAVSVKDILLRVFYTVFLLLIVYTIVLTCTLAIPNVMSTIIQSFDYNLNSSAEILLAGLSGLFFTAWLFAISFFIVEKIFNIYIKKIKETMPAKDETAEKQVVSKSSKRK